MKFEFRIIRWEIVSILNTKIVANFTQMDSIVSIKSQNQSFVGNLKSWTKI